MYKNLISACLWKNRGSFPFSMASFDLRGRRFFYALLRGSFLPAFPETRVPKGFRAPGLQDGKFVALGLHCFTPGLHLAKTGFKSREALGSGLHDKNFRALGLQRSPFGTLLREERNYRGSVFLKPIDLFCTPSW